jgi:hypothetical protein
MTGDSSVLPYRFTPVFTPSKRGSWVYGASSGDISNSTRSVVVDAITVQGRSYRQGLSLYALKTYSNE